MTWTEEARKKLQNYYSNQELRDCVKETVFYDREAMVDIILEHTPEHLLKEIAEGP